MKRKTFYYVSLSLPYIALILSGPLAYYFLYEIGVGGDAVGGLLGILFGSAAFFALGAIIWGPLYTWMVVVMLFWGRGKSADEVRQMFLLSPVLFACSMGIPASGINVTGLGLSLLWGLLHAFNLDLIAPAFFDEYLFEEAFALGMAWAMMAAVSLVVGYGFVGIVLLIERLMKRHGFFREKESAGVLPPLG